MKKKLLLLALAAVMAMLSCYAVFAEEGKTTLFIVGDGVAAAQGADKFPQQGWGEYVADVVTNITVENCAENEENLASYVENGAWQEVLPRVTAGDFVMVAFGADSVDPAKSENYYSAYLLKLAQGIKAAGAQGIFVTPAAVGSTIDANNRLNPLINSVKSVAASFGFTVADLNGRMRENYKDYQGTEKDGKVRTSYDALFLSKSQLSYFEQIGAVSDSAKQAAENKDYIHFSATGAKFAANLVAKELFEKENPFKQYTKDVTDPKQRTVRYDVISKMREGNLNGVFFDGMEYNGLPTQVFAYVGLPEGASAENKVPAMVLTHGAAGHAYKDWVQLWNKKGYAAISFYWREPDAKNDNTMPDGSALQYNPGPRRSDISDTALQGEKEDQFMYHATSDISLSYNLLNAMPEVQKDQIGLTGISWGGIIASRGMGEDTRFQFAMPVYGCGNLPMSTGTIHPTSVWDGKYTFKNTVDANMPVFWINVSNDTFFSLHATTQCALETNSDVLIILGGGHSQQHGSGGTGEIDELFSYADHMLKGGPALPKLSKISLSGRTASFTCEAEAGLEKARLIYNTTGMVYGNGAGSQATTEWTTVDLNPKTGKISVSVPANAKGFYVEVTDKNKNRMTTEYLEFH